MQRRFPAPYSRACALLRRRPDGHFFQDLMYPDRVLHWINDSEAPSSTGAIFEKRCPIDDRILTQVSRGDSLDVVRAVDAAAAAADAWGRLPAPRRGEILGRAALLLRQRQEEFSAVIAAETGKPLKNAAAEVGSSADLALFMDGEGSRFYGKT